MSGVFEILLVDDEIKVLEGLERLLHSQAGEWEMTFASSVTEALDVLAKRPPEAVLLDIEMPGKGGLELLSEIKTNKDTMHIEVVMLTGLQDSEVKRHALDLGAADLLNKPVVKEDLVARLNNALRLSAYHEELRAHNALLEKQLVQSQKMEVVGTLAAGVLHDLNNMLTAILGHSHLAKHHLEDGPKIQQDISRIGNAGSRAKQLVGQIVNFSRSAEAVREPCGLGQVVDECLDLLRPLLSHSVEVAWDAPETASFTCDGP